MKRIRRLNSKVRRPSGRDEPKAAVKQRVASTRKPGDIFGFMAGKVRAVGDIESPIPVKRTSKQQ